MNIDQERINFERFMSDDGKFPQAVERNSDGNYVLMQAASSWHVWQARARQDSTPNVSALVGALEDARETIAFALRANAPDYFTTDADIARHVDIQRIDAALSDHRKGGDES